MTLPSRRDGVCRAISSIGFPLVVLLCVGLLLACGRQHTPPVAKNKTSSQKPKTTPPKQPPTMVLESVPDQKGLENVLRITPHIYSGGEPMGEDGFKSLRDLGITTVVSVDSSVPDIINAKKYGLRYIQIPVSYEEISDKAGKSLARLVREVEGPIYIHCHHGTHRGPAAAAVACVADGAISADHAHTILKKARTAEKYKGLWRDVRNYQTPSTDAKLPELVSRADVGSLAKAMTEVDRQFDRLVDFQDAQWAQPKTTADDTAVLPSQVAVLLNEAFRESARIPHPGADKKYSNIMHQAEQDSSALPAILMDKNFKQANALMKNIKQSCVNCHAQYRDVEKK